MKVDKDLIAHVAELARLDLSDEEIEKFTPQLKEILEHFSKLDEVDVKDVKPSFQPIELRNRLRDDKKEPCLTQDKALLNTKHKKDGYFLGPSAV